MKKKLFPDGGPAFPITDHRTALRLGQLAMEGIEDRAEADLVATSPKIKPEAIQAVLSSESELQDFWTVNRNSYRFAATANEFNSNAIMTEGTWIVGRSREAVVKTVLGWEANRIQCVWEADEDGGWWRLANLPHGHTEDSLFDGRLDVMSDPTMDRLEVERQKQLQIFEHWEIDTTSPVRAYNKGNMNRLVLPLSESGKDFACEISAQFPATRPGRKNKRRKG